MPPDLPLRQWSPPVHANLVRMLEDPGEPSPFAVLDWDDTILDGDLSLSLLDACDAANGTRWRDTYFELLRTHGRAVAYPKITQWFAGHTDASFAALADEVIEDVFATGRAQWRQEMVDLIDAMHARGWAVWVVSASPAVAVRQIAARVGVPASRILAMALHTDDEGRFTDRVVHPPTFSEGKAESVRIATNGRPRFAAGDSRSDAPMLAMATDALLLHGHDVDLLADAEAAGWWVQHGWRHTPAEPGVRVHHG